MSDVEKCQFTLADARLDIRREVCPITYVRTKLALESLIDGQVLEILMTGDEPVRNIPRSAREDGHEIVALENLVEASNISWRLLIRKRSDG